MPMIRIIASAILLGSLLGSLQAQDVAGSRPNIVFMMADDMGMGDTSAYQDFTGNSNADQLHTPAMEKLANTRP